jgi:hypothetical protein
VPNLTTNLLAHTLEATHLEEAPRPIWGLDWLSGTQTEGVALTQFVLPDHLAAYSPPDENTIPERDNGTHGDAPRSEPALEQVRALVQNGELVHSCDGACDPD